jgi:Sap, sulfolipid-1-addressing protein
MLSALGSLLPIAVAVALSSVSIMATILILLSPKRNHSAIPFLIGWVVGMAGVVIVAAAGANALPISSFRAPQRAIAIGQIIVGLAVLVGAVLAWRRAARAPVDRKSRWLGRVDRMGPAGALGLAVVLNLRPKGLLLGAAAGLAIAGASLNDTDTAAVVAIYIGLASSTVIVPIVATLVAPARMEPRLVVTRDWLGHNSAYISVVVLVMVGFVILGAGLSRY